MEFHSLLDANRETDKRIYGPKLEEAARVMSSVFSAFPELKSLRRITSGFVYKPNRLEIEFEGKVEEKYEKDIHNFVKRTSSRFGNGFYCGISDISGIESLIFRFYIGVHTKRG